MSWRIAANKHEIHIKNIFLHYYVSYFFPIWLLCIRSLFHRFHCSSIKNCVQNACIAPTIITHQTRIHLEERKTRKRRNSSLFNIKMKIECMIWFFLEVSFNDWCEERKKIVFLWTKWCTDWSESHCPYTYQTLVTQRSRARMRYEKTKWKRKFENNFDLMYSSTKIQVQVKKLKKKRDISSFISRF